jgi:hypothetical protein
LKGLVVSFSEATLSVPIGAYTLSHAERSTSTCSLLSSSSSKLAAKMSIFFVLKMAHKQVPHRHNSKTELIPCAFRIKPFGCSPNLRVTYSDRYKLKMHPVSRSIIASQKCELFSILISTCKLFLTINYWMLKSSKTCIPDFSALSNTNFSSLNCCSFFVAAPPLSVSAPPLFSSR